MFGLKLRSGLLRRTPASVGEKKSVNWRLAMVIATVVGFTTPMAVASGAHAQSLRASSTLLQSASAHPGRLFNVIVEKHGHSGTPESLVRAAGGKITRELRIINAFSATVPGRALKSVARSDSVNWVSPNATVHQMGGFDGTVNTTNLANAYDGGISADRMWTSGYQGAGVNVAVIDSGVNPTKDLSSARILANTSVSSTDSSTTDGYGHGSHVAGMIAGNGSLANGQFIGIAPKAGILNVKVFNSQGQATVADVVNGLQWVYNNASAYNIKVVNLSLDSTLNQSYNVDPLDAACEVLWFNGITVVVASGNNELTSPGVLDSPANDPFVITVGAVNDQGTMTTADDTSAPFSAFGATLDGLSKPDVVAPGYDIVSTLASSSDYLAVNHPTHVVANGLYFMMSGTSMAAPIVSGAAALLLEANSSLNPDQVKYLLDQGATALYGQPGTGRGEVNVYNSYRKAGGWNIPTANDGMAPSSSLQQNGSGVPSIWNSSSWGTASWGSASWGSASWGSASWGSASWGSTSWGSDYWGKTTHCTSVTSKCIVPAKPKK